MTATKTLTISLLTCALAASIACSGLIPTEPEPAGPVAAPASSIQGSVNMVMSGLVAAFNGTNGSGGGHALGLGSLAPSITPSASSCNAAGCQINQSWEQRTACSSGGYFGVLAQLTGTTNQSGGTLNFRQYFSFNNCSSGGWVTNSSPYLTGGGTVRVFGGHQALNVTMGGGFIITSAPGMPIGRSECHFSGVILQWSSLTGNWANSGALVCTPGGEFRF